MSIKPTVAAFTREWKTIYAPVDLQFLPAAKREHERRRRHALAQCVYTSKLLGNPKIRWMLDHPEAKTEMRMGMVLDRNQNEKMIAYTKIELYESGKKPLRIWANEFKKIDAWFKKNRLEKAKFKMIGEHPHLFIRCDGTKFKV